MCDSDASGKVVALVCVSLAVALIVCLFLRFRPDRKINCVVRLYLRLASLYRQISLRAKCARTRHEPRGRPYVLSRQCTEPDACLARRRFKQCVGFYQVTSRTYSPCQSLLSLAAPTRQY